MKVTSIRCVSCGLMRKMDRFTLVVTLALTLLLTGCERSTDDTLRFIGPAQQLPMPTGSPLVLLASEKLAPIQPADALIVTNAAGRPVSCRIECVGPHLLLHPRDTRFNETESPYQVSLAWPPLGGSVSGASGTRMKTPFRMRFDVRPANPATETLRLLASADQAGLRIPNGADGARAACVTLEFSEAVDPASMDRGIQVIDAARREAIPGVRVEADPAAPNRAIIHPFASAPWLCAAGRYRIEILDALRSVGGLAALPAQRAFEVDVPNHLLQFGFSAATEVTGPAVAQVHRDGVLRPIPLHEPVLPTESGSLVALGGHGLTALFPRAPHTVRAQVLIPAAWFAACAGHDESGRRLITEIDLLADQEVPADLSATNLVVRLHQRNPRLAGGLSDRFDENLAAGDLCPLEDGHYEGMTPLGQSRASEPSRIIRLRFAEPCLVDTFGGDLVLTIEHDGVWSLLRPIPDAGITVLGRGTDDTDSAPTAFVLGNREVTRATQRSRAQPHVWIQTVQFPHVESAWQLVPEARQVTLHRDPGRHLQSEASEGRHFVVRYIGGRARRDAEGLPLRDAEGRLICDAVTPADQIPPRGGIDALRLVIAWLPSTELLRSSPSIEYILVAWK